MNNWISLRYATPNIERHGDKVLLFRVMNAHQKDLEISIHSTDMVKHCNADETWWQQLPEKPYLGNSIILQCSNCNANYREFNPTEEGFKICDNCLPF